METSALSSTNRLTTQTPTTRGFDDLGGQDFMALLIAELQAQDPMNPTDNKELVSQMAGIRQMEQSESLTKTLQTLTTAQRFGASTGMIGHYVAGTVTDSGGKDTEIQGLVIGVRYDRNGQGLLELHNGKSLPVDKVEQLTLVENLPQELQDQLQQEMATNDTSNTTARLIKGDTSARSQAGWAVQRFGQQVNQTAGLLDSLFAPVAG